MAEGAILLVIVGYLLLSAILVSVLKKKVATA